MSKLKGSISIGKVTCCGTPKADYISIRVEDELSSITFLEVKMGLEDFAKALMGLGNVPIEFELQGTDRVGKKYEHKTLEIHVPYRSGDIRSSDDLIDKAVSEQEFDGWVGSRRDCKNHHNWIKNATTGAVYNVHFCRWVDVEKTDENSKSE